MMIPGSAQPAPGIFIRAEGLYKVGDVVRAKVLTVDKDNEKFTLGIKQLSDDP